MVAGDSLIVVTYDVLDPDGDHMTVMLLAAGGEVWFGGSEHGVSGDIGPGIGSGSGKRIVLRPRALSELLDDGFVPRLRAFDGVGYGGEMIRVEPSDGPAFLIDRFELTNEEFAVFVRSDGYEIREYWIVDDGSIDVADTGWNYCGRFRWQAPRYWDLSETPPWSGDRHSGQAAAPVLGVSWFEAYAYARWAGKRLPKEAEWVIAAGLRERSFPWGDDVTFGSRPPTYALANCKLGHRGYTYQEFTSDGSEFAAPVGSYSPQGDGPLGLSDAVGNVWEWCDDVVAVVDYGTFSCATRPLRGGSWATGLVELRQAAKALCPLYRMDTVGFRCAGNE